MFNEGKEVLSCLNGNPVEEYKQLVRLVLDSGERFRKKHGEWLLYRISDQLFLMMDSWNGHLLLCEGSGEYDYWTGFKGRKLHSFGLDFGGLKVPKTFYGRLQDL